jgi:hypothetical protein
MLLNPKTNNSFYLSIFHILLALMYTNVINIKVITLGIIYQFNL